MFKACGLSVAELFALDIAIAERFAEGSQFGQLSGKPLDHEAEEERNRVFPCLLSGMYVGDDAQLQSVGQSGFRGSLLRLNYSNAPRGIHSHIDIRAVEIE